MHVFRLRMAILCLRRGLGKSVIGLVQIIIFGSLLILLLITINFPSCDKTKRIRARTIEENNNEESPSWIRISDSIYLYSAYHDGRISHVRGKIHERNVTLFRLIGIKRFPPMKEMIKADPLKVLKIKQETSLINYTCKLHVPNSNKEVWTENVTFHVIEEGVKLFAAVFVNCYFEDLSFSFYEKEAFISLVPSHVSEYPLKLLKISENIYKANLSVCIRPYFATSDSPLFLQESKILARLQEFLSYYSAMGVMSFTFYELTRFPKISRYLKLISRSQRVAIDIRKWNLPTGNSSELWDFGALAALNDCLYHNIRSVHLFFLDLDEFVVPQDNSKDLTEMLNNLEKERKPAQILFRNTFFCSEFCSQQSIRNCTIRTKRIWNPNLRSKFVVRPNLTVSVGHHTAHNFYLAGETVGLSFNEKRGIFSNKDPLQRFQRFQDHTLVAPVDKAVMNHYRECAPIKENFNRMTVKDEKILRFLRESN